MKLSDSSYKEKEDWLFSTQNIVKLHYFLLYKVVERKCRVKIKKTMDDFKPVSIDVKSENL